MNRRELFKRLAGAAAAAGLPAVAPETLQLPKDTERTMVVLSCSGRLPVSAQRNLRDIWKKTVAGTAWEKVPVIVTDESVQVHVHVDSRAITDEVTKRVVSDIRRGGVPGLRGRV
jgi:hypothetical protein